MHTLFAWDWDLSILAEPPRAVCAALSGAVRLGWLMLCRGRLAKAWRDNLWHVQEALTSSYFQVNAHGKLLGGCPCCVLPQKQCNTRFECSLTTFLYQSSR